MRLIVFSSDHCEPCKILKNNLEKNGIMYKDMNFDKMKPYEREWSKQFRVMSLPNLIFMHDTKDRVEKQLIGVHPIDTIKGILNGSK